MNFQGLLRLVFSSAIRSAIYRGMRGANGIVLILILCVAGIGFLFL